MGNNVITLDVRPIPVRDKHSSIFRTFDEMAIGATLLLVNDHDPKPLYYQFAAERGGRFEWNYLERGPEVWKVEITKKGDAPCGHLSGEAHLGHEHHHFETATEALKQDHRIIEKVLAVLEKVAQNPREASLETWEKAIDFIRNFADKCHHLKEEKLFFPALEARGIPCEGGPIGMMLLEHEEGRAYVRAMAEALVLAKEDPEAAKSALVENALLYLRLLRQHIAKEDEILFEMADEALTPEEQKELLREFEEHEAKEIGPGVHEKYLTLAHELEHHSD